MNSAAWVLAAVDGDGPVAVAVFFPPLFFDMLTVCGSGMSVGLITVVIGGLLSTTDQGGHFTRRDQHQEGDHSAQQYQ